MIGAGNVSTHISRHLHLAGHTIACVYSRNQETAGTLAHEVHSTGVTQLDAIPDKADFYLVCVPDDIIPEIAGKLSDRKGVWLHCAGALSMDVFSATHTEYGVMYPLQSLSKELPVMLTDTPMLVEGSSPKVTATVRLLADSISGNVYEMNSDSRLLVHLAAVFANNFTNHMVHIAQQILKDHDFDLGLLEPLLNQTYHKLTEMEAVNAQTGPAVRMDEETMQKHRELLEKSPEWKNLYTFISRDIGKARKK